MPDVICDTSPLQYLHQLELLHLLPALAGQILVPPAVAPPLDQLDALGFRLAPHTRLAALMLAGETDPG